MGCYYSWCSTRLNSLPSPLLIYINDIIEDIHSHIRLFADDTSLNLIVNEPYVAAMQLNSDLTRIHLWAERWLVKFNPAKSESILISRKTNKPYNPPLKMNDEPIKEVTIHKKILAFSFLMMELGINTLTIYLLKLGQD